MIYARNKETGEHRVAVIPGCYAFDEKWELIQADADGWVEWRRGMEQPVADDQIVDVKCTSDYWEDAYGIEASAVGWSFASDVTHYRPILNHPDQPKEWRGPEDGLPPVGTVCEVYIANRDAWTEAEVKAHVDGLALFKNGTGGHFYGRTAEHYRPIRTDRERWIAAAEHTIENSTGELANSTHLGLLYDAGLARLTEE